MPNLYKIQLKELDGTSENSYISAMATQLNQRDLDLSEQMARIHRMGAESEKRAQEREMMRRDADEQIERIRKLSAESDKYVREQMKIMQETKMVTVSTVFQGLIAVAALMGAGAALVKLFFP
jgi:hypothetical protein